MNAPRLLYVVTEDWYFLSHRLPMARAARDAGFEVHVATNVGAGADAIRAEGFVLHDVPFARGRLSPRSAISTILAVRKIHLQTSPVISHHVALQPTILGSMAALGRDVICLNALTGFGFAFTSKTMKARLVRPVLAAALCVLLGRRDHVALVQNPDDRDALLALGVTDKKITLISGSGVDLERFTVTPEPPLPLIVGFAGRLLADKGIYTLVEAHRILRARGLDVVLRVAGSTDPANPTSVSETQLESWRGGAGIELLGRVEDMPAFWSGVHVAVLPSRREGLPKSLLEAAACGRPLVASDVPGCREVVIAGRTGLLVSVDDPRQVADAIETLARSYSLRIRYGQAARELAESKFGSRAIARQISDLYAQLLRASATA